MSFTFKDYLNRRPLIVAAITTVISMGVYALIAKAHKLNIVEWLTALPAIALMFYFIHELKYCMDLQLSQLGITYIGKRSNWLRFRPETRTYRWDEVSSVDFNNGYRTFTINFINGEKIKLFAEADKSQSFFDTVRLYCSDKVESQEEVATYLAQAPTVESEYDKSLFRGLSIGMPILFIGIALLLFFAIFMAIKQTP